MAAASYIFQNEEKFFYDHHELEQEFIYDFDIPFQELQINLNEEVQLHAIWFTRNNPKGLVLYFPDGDDQTSDFQANQNYCYTQGYSLLIPDYRGTGKSTSKYQKEEDIYEDAQQWYKMALRLADTGNMIISGRGFGTGIAAQLGGEQTADLIWLENPYYAWNEIMLKKYFWWLPHTYFTQYQIPLWTFVRKSTQRIILVHATQNKKFPIDNSHRLLEFLKPGDELIEIESDQIDYHSAPFQKSMEKIGNTSQLF